MSARTGCEWAILVPTIPRRSADLARLLDVLLPQVEPYGGMVHVVGWLNVGTPRLAELRDSLLAYADDVLGAEYVSFIDDDDLISHDYVAQVMHAVAIGNEPDHIGFVLDYWKDGVFKSRVPHSLRHNRWGHERLPRTDPRKPGELKLWRDFTHVDPMRTEWARRGKFAKAGPRIAEDRVWCRQLREAGFSAKAGATEVFIDRSLYSYFWTPALSAWDERSKLNDLGTATAPRPIIDSTYFTWHPESL